VRNRYKWTEREFHAWEIIHIYSFLSFIYHQIKIIELKLLDLDNRRTVRTRLQLLKETNNIFFWNRFDARGKPLSMGRSWSDLTAFGLRANFRFTVHGLVPHTGYLVINNTTIEDEGIYRCRVDFKNSPARHYRAKLNVIGKIPNRYFINVF